MYTEYTRLFMGLIQENQYYSYADYLEWDESVRAEIINGNVYMMSPPTRFHQGISGALFNRIYSFLEGKSCKVYAAPFGVRLFPEKDLSDDTVVEPDITVVCDSSKLDERGCNGAPDMIIEILSPSTEFRDRLIKFNNYLKAEVREYWIVDPDTRSVQAHILDRGRYVTSGYGVIDPSDPDSRYVSDMAPVSVLPGLVIDLKTVFAE
jgi:Uma2 family endonuclease